MGVPTSEVGYTPAVPCPGGRTTNCTRTCGGIGQKKNPPGKNSVFCLFLLSTSRGTIYSLMVQVAPTTGKGSDTPISAEDKQKRLEHKWHFWTFLTYLGFKCNFKFNNLSSVSFTCFNNAPRSFIETLCRQYYACTCTLYAARHSRFWFTTQS